MMTALLFSPHTATCHVVYDSETSNSVMTISIDAMVMIHEPCDHVDDAAADDADDDDDDDDDALMIHQC